MFWCLIGWTPPKMQTILTALQDLRKGLYGYWKAHRYFCPNYQTRKTEKPTQAKKNRLGGLCLPYDSPRTVIKDVVQVKTNKGSTENFYAFSKYSPASIGQYTTLTKSPGHDILAYWTVISERYILS